MPSDSAPSSLVIVSGLPRSGTSMMMGLPPLTDALRQADTDNPEGYYEFERAKALTRGDIGWLPLAQGKAVKVISALLPHLPDAYHYRVIFMERHLQEVLASQRKMLARRGEPEPAIDDAAMAAVFEKHLAQTRSLLAQRPNMAVLSVHYRDVLADAPAQVARVCAFLQQPLDAGQMVAVVNEGLYRNRQTGGTSAA
jgi:hypothetical protein